MKKLVFAALFFITFSLPAIAKESHVGHAGHAGHAGHHMGAPMQTMAKTKKTVADKDLYDVSVKMVHAMDVAFISTPDSDFVRAMIPHHQGAIDMAKVVLKHGHDKNIAWLARNIIKAQNAEIYWMRRWLKRSDQPLIVETGNNAMEKSANTPERQSLLAIHHGMHLKMDVALTGDPDYDFVRAMIPHHQGAVDMSGWLLQNGRNPEVKGLAREIMREQRAEIAFMRSWLHHKEKTKCQN